MAATTLQYMTHVSSSASSVRGSPDWAAPDPRRRDPRDGGIQRYSATEVPARLEALSTLYDAYIG